MEIRRRPANRSGNDDGVADLPTPRSTLHARYVDLRVYCRSCLHSAPADLQALIDAGRGDEPVVNLRFRCTRCGSQRTEAMVIPKSTSPKMG